MSSQDVHVNNVQMTALAPANRQVSADGAIRELAGMFTEPSLEWYQ